MHAQHKTSTLLKLIPIRTNDTEWNAPNHGLLVGNLSE